MAAGHGAREPSGGGIARPALTVLQLDTSFERVPGDIAAPATYARPIEIRTVKRASVSTVVTADPTSVDLDPFLAAAARAKAPLVTTSCGFLAPHHDALAQAVRGETRTSALSLLPELTEHFGTVLVVTFDAAALSPDHLASAQPQIVGLDPQCHLANAIRKNLNPIDQTQAALDVAAVVRTGLTPATKAILLECTNLPPYKHAIRATTDLPIFDCLTMLENAQPGLVRPAFL